MERGEKIVLEYKCFVCWYHKMVTYKDYMIAKMNKVYCDDCITRQMKCITPASEELIATLD